mmetsp:Transcript_25041/g.58073  ORF Transcript_25041/g.58073 Transcript_25041/m.58073 type:complete len:219 (+) Transcript_25041:91-747(+)
MGNGFACPCCVGRDKPLQDAPRSSNEECVVTESSLPQLLGRKESGIDTSQKRQGFEDWGTKDLRRAAEEERAAFLAAQMVERAQAHAAEALEAKKAAQRALLERVNKQIADDQTKISTGKLTNVITRVSFVETVETIMIGGDSPQESSTSTPSPSHAATAHGKSPILRFNIVKKNEPASSSTLPPGELDADISDGSTDSDELYPCFDDGMEDIVFFEE